MPSASEENKKDYETDEKIFKGELTNSFRKRISK